MMVLFWKVLFVASWLAAFLVLSQAEDPGEERYLQECVTTNRPDGWNQINNNWWSNCANTNSCEQCHIGCYNDEDCRGVLKCRVREDNEVVPGCEGYPWTGNNYCYNPNPSCWYPYAPTPAPIPTPAPTPNPTYNTKPVIDGLCTAPNRCPRCSGVCFQDKDCQANLYCHVGTTSVLGCDDVDQGTMSEVPSGGGFCGWVPPTPAPTYSPTISAEPSVSRAPSHLRDHPWPPDRPTAGMLVNHITCPPEGCPACSGKRWGCWSDWDCAAGLKCWTRGGWETISGCDGIGIPGHHYCFDPTTDGFVWEPEVLTQPERPVETNVYFTNAPQLPDRCEMFAANVGGTVNVPFSGTSGVGAAKSVYGDVSYIFLIDVSGSTIKLQGECGNKSVDSQLDKVLDCEIWAIEEIQKAVLKSGNVDLEGLAWFGTDGFKIDQLVSPWSQNPGRRDSIFVEFARQLVAGGLTNYEAGVTKACELVRLAANDNPKTVVIMVSDGKPNRGKSVKDLVQNNCGGAVFQTFAITALADCYGIDTDGLEPGDDPDTLYQIAEYTGGTCTVVPDVTKLPELLVTLEKTTWDGVRVLVNDVEQLGATIIYTDNPGFEGPKDTTYHGTVSVGPGEWDLCLEAMASTSGVTERLRECQKINVLTIQSDTPTLIRSSLLQEHDASFNINVVSLGPKGGCDTDLSGIPVTIKSCNDNSTVTTLTTGPTGSVNYQYSNTATDRTTKIDCFYSCFKDSSNNEGCTKTVVEWQDYPSAAPSSSPSASPSRDPSGQPSLSPTVSSRPSSAAASSTPSATPSVTASNKPSVARSAIPSASPSTTPSKAPSGTPSAKPSVLSSSTPTSTLSVTSSNKPSAARSAIPSPSPSTKPSKVASDSPSEAPSVKSSSSPTSAPSENPSSARSAIPSPSPSTKPSKVASDSPSASPSKSIPLTTSPTAHTSAFCNEIQTSNTCTVCEPFRSIDYCDPTESFPQLIQQRTSTYRTQPDAMGSYWFHFLEDKVAGYLLTIGEKYPAPSMKACATTVDTLKDILAQPTIGIVSVDDKFTLPVGQGIVIKATNFHSNQGVFILLNDGLSNGAELTMKDLLTDQYYSYGDVKTMLAAWQASKIIVEELVGGALPDEYKFHVVDGKVQAIDIIIDRGSDCPCYAVVDVDFNRLDSNGCFEPSGSDQQIFDVDKPVCTAIDFGTGARRAGPVKKDMYLCSDVKKPKQCVLDDMTTIAESLSKTIGVYMRIDMFLVGDQVYVQEYSANPMNGLRHCASKIDSNGCVDSCFLGREWKAAGEPFGGNVTTTPVVLNGFLAKDAAAQCDLANQAIVDANAFKSSCTP